MIVLLAIFKCCNDYIECGLCELRFDSLEVLEIHLTTCEIYECADCLEKYKCLSDMKTHINEEHTNGNGFNHMKMDREDSTKVNFKACIIWSLILFSCVYSNGKGS